MALRRLLAASAFVATSAAQFASYASNNIGIAVNIPSDTASSGKGSIYLQLSAPGGTEWFAFGQGTRMSGSNMIVVYSADSTNVTVSPRIGNGYSEPQENPDASIFVLEGTGITSDGSMVANIRCDSCLSWSGGTMDPTSTSSNWIYAWKNGDAIDSTSTSATIVRHDRHSTFSLDLTQGTGGSSTNPFIAATNNGDSSQSQSETASGTATATDNIPDAATATAPATTGSATSARATATLTTPATTTPTNGVSGPIVSSNPDSSNSGATSSSSGPDDGVRIGHAVVMGLVFVVLFPLSALTVYLPHHQKVRYIHAPLQVVSVILMLVGLGLGIKLAQNLDMIDGYHQVIGFIVVAWMVLFQPALGAAQHMHYIKNGTSSPMGLGHRWLGRIVMALGIVNGGLGFLQTGPVGSLYVPNYSIVVYSVVAAVIFLFYIAVVIYSAVSSKRASSLPGEKPRPGTEGYEMHGKSFESQRQLRA